MTRINDAGVIPELRTITEYDKLMYLITKTEKNLFRKFDKGIGISESQLKDMKLTDYVLVIVTWESEEQLKLLGEKSKYYTTVERFKCAKYYENIKGDPQRVLSINKMDKIFGAPKQAGLGKWGLA